jgi:flagellar biosynthesis protein FlhG
VALDQAAALRDLMRPTPRQPLRQTRVIAVTSGKGGVGKTSLTVNLAIALAREGKRAVVLDGDLGLANVDVMLGIQPRHTLAHVIAGQCSLAEAMVPAPGGIWVVPGASGLEALADMSEEQRQQLISALGELEGRADVLLIDTAAGVSREVSAFLEAAPEVIVVTTPDPTAITDAYALVKVATSGRRPGPDAAGLAGGRPRFRLVVNQANDVGEAIGVARKLQAVARQFLNVEIESLGYVPSDRSVSRSTRGQVPLLVAYPSSPAALRVVDMARRLTSPAGQPGADDSGIIEFLRRMAGDA